MGEEPRPLTPRPRPRPSGRAPSALGARACRSAAALALAIVAAGPARVDAQDRPVRPTPDSAAVADTLREEGRAAADTAFADTVFHNLPGMEAPGPTGWAQGVWTWDHPDVLETGAVTLAELFAEVPGMVTLLAGDFGTPTGITAFGAGGGRVRVIRDGFEVLPLEGGVADLARIGLGGIARVRLERHPGELVVWMESMGYDEPRPYSLVEAGTGDLNTNVFRGTFLAPRALGGSLAVAIERTDSRGPRGDEPGQRTGTWIRYQLHRGDGAGLALDLRRVGTESDAEPYAASVTRTDWTVRGRVRPVEGLTAEAYWGRSTHAVEDAREVYADEGGRRSQMGIRAAWRDAGLFADGAYRRFGGDALPASRLDLSVGGDREEVGGAAAEVGRASWSGTSTTTRRVRGWTRPVLGVSAFGSWESGTAGARSGPLVTAAGSGPADSTASEPVEPDAPRDAGPPPFRVTDRTAWRIGAQWAWRGFVASGARLRVETDSLLPLGLEPDRGEPALAGGARTGWELRGRVPAPWRGLHVEGSLQRWDEPWRYLPRRIYQGAVVYNRRFLETGNFELWAAVGVRGHDPMSVHQVVDAPAGDEEAGDGPGVELAAVPFYQSWYGRLQLRIVTVRVFVAWDNFTIRRNLQDYPGRLLPQTRAVYGIRWTLWN